MQRTHTRAREYTHSHITCYKYIYRSIAHLTTACTENHLPQIQNILKLSCVLLLIPRAIWRQKFTRTFDLGECVHLCVCWLICSDLLEYACLHRDTMKWAKNSNANGNNNNIKQSYDDKPFAVSKKSSESGMSNKHITIVRFGDGKKCFTRAFKWTANVSEYDKKFGKCSGCLVCSVDHLVVCRRRIGKTNPIYVILSCCAQIRFRLNKLLERLIFKYSTANGSYQVNLLTIRYANAKLIPIHI